MYNARDLEIQKGRFARFFTGKAEGSRDGRISRDLEKNHVDTD